MIFNTNHLFLVKVSMQNSTAKAATLDLTLNGWYLVSRQHLVSGWNTVDKTRNTNQSINQADDTDLFGNRFIKSNRLALSIYRHNRLAFNQRELSVTVNYLVIAVHVHVYLTSGVTLLSIYAHQKKRTLTDFRKIIKNCKDKDPFICSEVLDINSKWITHSKRAKQGCSFFFLIHEWQTDNKLN